MQVRHQFDYDPEGQIDLVAWVAALPCYLSAEEQAAILSAAQWSIERARATVDEYTHPKLPLASFYTGLEMVEILSDLHLDVPTLIAAVLYRAVRERRITIEDINSRFGSEVVQLIDGVGRMAAITQVNAGRDDKVLGQTEAQSETVRKMLVALVDDVRVALLKLAERTCAIRAVKHKPQKRYRVAREVFDIYAPLAHRLGIGQLKWELEDLSFRYLEPATYKKIARLLAEKRLAREEFIDHIAKVIKEKLADQGTHAQVEGRAKHIYSIWRKMQRKGLGFSQIYDIRAVRIIVESVADCYQVLGTVHGLWRTIPNEFDDYIASPKANGYRSLHTAVIGPDDQVLEIQVRTQEMHDEAELGVCAHWRYKGTDASTGRSGYEKKLSWLRQMLDLKGESGEFALFEHFSADDRIYVFTPDGHAVSLEEGSTPLDFAYHVHTDIGHQCVAAKVNGREVELNYQLSNGEQVEILTGAEAMPSHHWLNPSLGYCKSQRTRAKIRQWFRNLEREECIAAGQRLVDTEFANLQLTSVDYKRLSQRLQCETVEDLFYSVGNGDLDTEQVVLAANSLLVAAENVVEIRPAQSAEIEVVAEDRRGLLADITSILADSDLDLVGVHSHVDTDNGLAYVNLKMANVEVTALSSALARLRQRRGIKAVSRSA